MKRTHYIKSSPDVDEVLSVLLSDDDFCYIGLHFGFLFREVCAQVGPSMGLTISWLCPWEEIEGKWLLVARDRFDRQHQQNMSFRW